MQILIDDFNGEPKEFYQLVKEEVQKREVPDVTFSDDIEARAKKGGWFSGTETTSTLIVANKIQSVKVLAYRYGRSFLVSTRSYWTDRKFAEQEAEGKLLWLEEAYSGCFAETVNRAMRTALSQYLQKRQVAVPANLDPKEVFYSREAHAAGDK